jgi:hypothetical protein
MALALYLWLGYSRSFSDWLILLGGLVIGILIYALLVWLLRVDEFQAVIRAIRLRLSSKDAAG